MKENDLTLQKARSKRYPAQTFMDAVYTDDTALLANTPAQVECLLHCLEKAADSIGLHVNADKTEYMCFNQNQTRDIYTQTGGSLKLADKFTHLKAENYITTRLAKAWSPMDRLLIIWKSDLSDKYIYRKVNVFNIK